MRFIIPVVAAFAALTSAAPTVSNGVVAREEQTIQAWMADLTSMVKTHTDALNSITAAVPANADQAALKQSAAPAIVHIEAISSILKDASAKIKAVKQNKRETAKRASTPPAPPGTNSPNLGDLPADVLSQLNGNPTTLANLALPLIQELNPALGTVLNTLALGEVYLAIQPLLQFDLPFLVIELSSLVTGLVTALTPLLTGLGGLLGPLLLGLGL